MHTHSTDSFLEHPIIISGFARSGTTLLKSLLTDHPQIVFFPSELDYGKTLVSSEIKHMLFDPTEITRRLFNAQKSGNCAQHSADGMHQALANNGSSCAEFWEQLQTSITPAIDEKELLQTMVYAYSKNIKKGNVIKAWGEKSPNNIFYYHLFKKWFGDNLQWIHIERDPLDVYASYKKYLRSNRGALEKEKNNNVKLVSSPSGFCFMWKHTKNWARKAQKDIENFHLIVYEELVQNPEKIMREIVEKLGLSFDKVVLEPTLYSNTWPGNSMHGTIHKGISTQSINSGSKELTREEQDDLISLLKNPPLALRLKQKSFYIQQELKWLRYF